jgi:hypothetical protein
MGIVRGVNTASIMDIGRNVYIGHGQRVVYDQYVDGYQSGHYIGYYRGHMRLSY